MSDGKKWAAEEEEREARERAVVARLVMADKLINQCENNPHETINTLYEIRDGLRELHRRIEHADRRSFSLLDSTFKKIQDFITTISPQ